MSRLHKRTFILPFFPSNISKSCFFLRLLFISPCKSSVAYLFDLKEMKEIQRVVLVNQEDEGKEVWTPTHPLQLWEVKASKFWQLNHISLPILIKIILWFICAPSKYNDIILFHEIFGKNDVQSYENPVYFIQTTSLMPWPQHME